MGHCSARSTESIRKVHDFLTVGAAAPLQAAGAFALKLPDSYYQRLAETYRVKRDRMLGILENAGFQCFRPRGAYYVMTDISRFGFPDDVAFARDLVQRIGIAVVPDPAFTTTPLTAPARSASRFAKRKRRWPRPPSAFRACVHPDRQRMC